MNDFMPAAPAGTYWRARAMDDYWIALHLVSDLIGVDEPLHFKTGGYVTGLCGKDPERIAAMANHLIHKRNGTEPPSAATLALVDSINKR